MRAVFLLIGLLVAACQVTPDEIRQQVPHLTAMLPDSHDAAARCVARGYENAKSDVVAVFPVEVRDYPRDDFTELIARSGEWLIFLVEFKQATTGSEMRMFYNPPVFGAETQLDWMSEAVTKCGGRILERRKLGVSA